MNQHLDELISASLSGDLSDAEQTQLDAHLRECPQCRDTMAAFADQRRLVSGMRHTSPPADLGARVRTGLERGTLLERPWWRRPGGILTLGAGLATMAAAAALALVVINLPARPPVGASPSASPSVEATPSGSTAATPSATPGATPTAPAAGLVPPGDLAFLSLTGPLGSQELSLSLYDKATAASKPLVKMQAPAGPPIAASLSPTGEWLAYQARNGLKGTNEIWAVRLSDGETRDLGETSGDDPFTKRMTWSLDGRFLAYTGLFGAGQPTLDVGLFDTQSGTAQQLTFLKAAYAASFDGERLWISVVGDPPVSYLVPLDGDLSNPASAAIRTLDATFLPIFSPDGTRAIYWRGRMTQQGFGWIFSTGGMPYLSVGSGDDPFAGEKQLFPTLLADQNAFTSAEIAWGPDSDWFVVWNANWTGDPQTGPSGERFPDPTYIYFGQATGSQIDTTPGNWIRVTDGTRTVVDVLLWPNRADPQSTPMVAVTLGIGGGGESEGSPGEMAHLLLTIAGPSDSTGDPTLGDPNGWNGPAVLGPGS